MCRLLYLPKNVRPPADVLDRWLNRLDKSNGGDGCGYASRERCLKGVTLTAADCATAINKHRGAVLFHTRRISCGLKSDNLCHPFACGKRRWLVHNGHWHCGVIASRLLKGSWSDSSIAAYYIKLYSWRSFTRECHAGVWLMLTRRGCCVHYMSGSLFKEVGTGALCSEPCVEWGEWKRVEHGTYGSRREVQIEKPKLLPTVGEKKYSSFAEYAQDCDEELTEEELEDITNEDEEVAKYLRERVDWQTQHTRRVFEK